MNYLNSNLELNCINVKKNKKNKFIESVHKIKTKISSKNNFFDKKKKVFLFFWFSILLLLIFFTVFFLISQNPAAFSESFVDWCTKKRFFFFLGWGLLFFLINELFIVGLIYKIQTQSFNIIISFKNWFSFGIIFFFIQTITPFSIGGEPFAIWWLKKKGLTLQEASSISAVVTLSWFISQFLITWPSFIYITVCYFSTIFSNTYYWLVFSGLVLDFLGGLIIFVISFSSKIHFYFSIFFNKIKKFFYFSYLDKEHSKEKYLKFFSFKKTYLKNLKNKKTFIVIFLFLIQNFFLYLFFSNIVYFFQADITFLKLFNYWNLINIATTANNVIPSPSSEGFLQYTIMKLQNIDNDFKIEKLNAVIIIWRFFSKYIGLIICLVSFMIMSVIKKKPKTNKCFHSLDIY